MLVMDFSLCGSESHLFVHAAGTGSCSVCFTAKIPELCSLHVILMSSCLCIHSSGALLFFRFQWGKEGRKMRGDAGGKGDVDAQLETCCSNQITALCWCCLSRSFPPAPTEQKPPCPFTETKLTFKNPGDVCQLQELLQSWFASKPG